LGPSCEVFVDASCHEWCMPLPHITQNKRMNEVNEWATCVVGTRMTTACRFCHIIMCSLFTNLTSYISISLYRSSYIYIISSLFKYYIVVAISTVTSNSWGATIVLQQEEEDFFSFCAYIFAERDSAYAYCLPLCDEPSLRCSVSSLFKNQVARKVLYIRHW
jgi:hypothetical protein